MQGVTTAIVAFIFVCIVYPHLVKHKAQFYWALAFVLLIILLDALAHMVAGGNPDDPTRHSSFAPVAYVLSGFFQIISIILLILSAGGLTIRELAGEMANAYEVLRRGEEKKEIIIPLRGQMPGRKAGNDEPRERIKIDMPETPSEPPKKPEGESSNSMDK